MRCADVDDDMTIRSSNLFHHALSLPLRSCYRHWRPVTGIGVLPSPCTTPSQERVRTPSLHASNTNTDPDDRIIVWFDIDNTLYSASSKISQAMGERIHGKSHQIVAETCHSRCSAYFVGLGLSHEEASELHHRYYSQYGLALRGLKRHHDVGNAIAMECPMHVLTQSIDVLDFDRKCDGSLPLERMISYDPAVRKLFEDIDRSKAQVWALTNAYKPVRNPFLSSASSLTFLQHAQRVLKILKLDDLIDGLVYCDYTVPDFSCKPEAEFYQMVSRRSRITPGHLCNPEFRP